MEDNSLENEIKLTDNQIKLILHAFKVVENEMYLSDEEKELIIKLSDCIYGC